MAAKNPPLTRNLIALILLAVLATPAHASEALGFKSDDATSRHVILKLSDLRSAYLLRDGAVRYDANSHSADALRAPLQPHFDEGLGLQ